MRLVFLMYLALGLVCSGWFLGVMLMMKDRRWLPSGDDRTAPEPGLSSPGSPSGAPFDGHVQEKGAAGAERLLQGGAELAGLGHPHGLHAHAAGHVHEA